MGALGLVDDVLRLGGAHLDVGQRPEEGHVVLADPEGGALCVIPPTSSFLADAARLVALGAGHPEPRPALGPGTVVLRDPDGAELWLSLR